MAFSDDDGFLAGCGESAPVTLWDSWLNAQLYAEYGDRFPLYRNLNRRLIGPAGIGTSRRTLDLGCGTGATTRSCLEVLPRDSEIVAADGSEAMIGLARARVADRRVRFVHARAETLTDRVGGPFDRVVSNAAFSTFDHPDRVFGQLAELTSEGAALHFNLPAERVQGEDVEPHPFQLHLGRAVTRLGGAAIAGSARIDLSEWEASMDDSGFNVQTVERFSLETRQGELVELMGLPAMIGRAADHLSLADRRQAWQDAELLTDPELPVAVDWLYVSARRRAC